MGRGRALGRKTERERGGRKRKRGTRGESRRDALRGREDPGNRGEKKSWRGCPALNIPGVAVGFDAPARMTDTPLA